MQRQNFAKTLTIVNVWYFKKSQELACREVTGTFLWNLFKVTNQLRRTVDKPTLIGNIKHLGESTSWKAYLRNVKILL